jgi:hypothetical protein
MKPQILQAYEYLFSAVQDIGGKRKNVISFMDNGIPESSTFQLRPNYQTSYFPIIFSETHRMGSAWVWTDGNAKYHGFWVRTVEQDIFALFRNLHYQEGDKHWDGTKRANFNIADAEIILLWNEYTGQFCLARWDGSAVVEDRPFLVAAATA